MEPYRLCIALACESFEDFPTRLSVKNAGSLLKSWTALWHPSLVGWLKDRPDILSITNSDLDEHADGISVHPQDAGLCIVVPSFASNAFDRHFANADGQIAVCQESPDQTRTDIVANLIASLKSASGTVPGQPTPPTGSADASNPSEPQHELAKDFFALGYAWLQVRLMTLHERYSTNLNDKLFDAELVEAATAWTGGDLESASKNLTRCFDLLLEERNSYYSVEPELLDFVLVEATTIDSKLDSQLTREHPTNLLITGDVIALVAQQAPQHVETIKGRLNDGSLTIVGGLQRELPASLLPLETQLRQFQAGRKTIESILGVCPRSFVRRRFGLTSMTPGLLEQLDYTGACHITLDGGKLPVGHGMIMRWVGDDAQTVPAIATVPLDANDPRSFLNLGVRIAKQIDAEHSSAIILAHWPDRFCESFQDLIRVTRHGALLGEFTGLDDYFEAAYDPGYGDPFTAEEYESPGLSRDLQQEVQDPISSFIRHWELHYLLLQCQNLATMFAFANSDTQADIASTLLSWQQQIQRIAISIDRLVDFSDKEVERQNIAQETQQALNALRSDMVACFSGSIENADALPDKSPAELTTEPNEQANDSTCWINATSFPSHALLPGGVTADIPAMGWTTLSKSRKNELEKSLGGPPVDNELTLRNEHFQVSVDPKTGGVRSLHSYAQRQTQASQRLSVRFARNQSFAYADMVADDVRTERISRAESQIVSAGRLIDPKTNQTLCQFTQTITVRRKATFADFQIDLQNVQALPNDSNHYICSRLAWHDESSPVLYGSPENQSRSTNAWTEAPTYVRINQPDHAVTLLTCGLPWHRRSGRNRLDSILVTGNESQRRFRMSLGLDCANDLTAATRPMTPPFETPGLPDSLAADGWMFHFSNRNIAAIFCEPILDQNRVVGVRWRLLETQGRRGKLKLTCPFQVDRAERKMFDGPDAEILKVENRTVEIEFTRNEYFEIHVFTASAF